MKLTDTAIAVLKKIKDNRVIYGKRCNYFCDFADLVDNKNFEDYLLFPNTFIWDPINDEIKCFVSKNCLEQGMGMFNC